MLPVRMVAPGGMFLPRVVGGSMFCVFRKGATVSHLLKRGFWQIALAVGGFTVFAETCHRGRGSGRPAPRWHIFSRAGPPPGAMFFGFPGAKTCHRVGPLERARRHRALSVPSRGAQPTPAGRAQVPPGSKAEKG